MSAAGVEGFQVEASPSSSPLMRSIAVKTRPKCLELIPQRHQLVCHGLGLVLNGTSETRKNRDVGILTSRQLGEDAVQESIH